MHFLYFQNFYLIFHAVLDLGQLKLWKVKPWMPVGGRERAVYEWWQTLARCDYWCVVGTYTSWNYLLYDSWTSCHYAPFGNTQNHKIISFLRNYYNFRCVYIFSEFATLYAWWRLSVGWIWPMTNQFMLQPPPSTTAPVSTHILIYWHLFFAYIRSEGQKWQASHRIIPVRYKTGRKTSVLYFRTHRSWRNGNKN